jgi:hypothetical protein
MKHYLFTHEDEGEFLVGACDVNEAYEILKENDLIDGLEDGYDILTEWEAENSGLDEL